MLPAQFVATGIKPDKKNRRVSIQDIAVWNQLAIRLGVCVQTVRGHVYADAIPTWVSDFRLIHEKDGVPIQVVVNVLNWYCEQKEMGQRGLPQCWSGKTFRKVFRWIFEMYEPPRVLLPATKGVERDMAFFADRTRERGIDAAELADCLSLVEDWVGKARKAVRKNNRGKDQFAATRHLAEPLATFPSGFSFVASYLEFILDLTEGWDLWQGNLTDFKPPQKHFMRYLNSLYRERWQTNLSPSESKWLMGGR